MLVKPECMPCYLRQAISTLRFAGWRDDDINKTLTEIVKIIPGLSLDATPAENSTILLRKLYDMIGNQDPYASMKEQWNDFVLQRVEGLIHTASASKDPLLAAFKISVAGNIIDMGITPDFDIGQALDEITSKEFDMDDYASVKEMLAGARKVLVIGDNCGEIAFDTVLVRQMLGMGLEVVYAVKEKPVLNDATMEDAHQTGMTDLCRVITTGNGYLGVPPELCSDEFLTEYKEADVVISKGQANFETLEGSELTGGKTVFVLRAKCQLIADCLGARLGDIVLIKDRR